MKITIRPLRAKDAAISYRWRNNPEIWKYTKSKPDKKITYEIELAWLREVLKRPNERRFAICVGEDSQYIGNVQLTDIDERTAQFHIFIGEIDYHGKGVGTKSTLLILDYAFSVLELETVYLFVNKNNTAAIKLYEKCGFLRVEEVDEVIRMRIVNEHNQN
jgi:RimJ/RimL family protein N-acetyltransferase